MHDVFIEIGKKIGLLRKPEAFVTWCNRIVNAKCNAYLRKKYREKKRQEKPPKILKEEKYTRRKLDDQEKKLLASIIDAFPAKQAEAMSMHYIDGDTIEIIANKLGVPEGTVKSRLYYGRKAFEKIVKK